MKLIDEKGKLFGAVSVIDLFVLLIAVILVFAVYTKFNTNEVTSSLNETEDITYTVKIEKVRQGTANAFREGDLLFDQENNVQVGTITGVDVTEAKEAAQKIDGTYAMGTVHGRYDIVLTVDSSCQVVGGRYYIQSSDEVNVNREKKYYTKYAKFEGTIKSLEVSGEAA